jgi:hypothetical protein
MESHENLGRFLKFGRNSNSAEKKEVVGIKVVKLDLNF